MAELHKVIAASAQPLSRLRHACEAHLVTKRIRATELKKMQDKQDALNDKAAAAAKKLEEATKAFAKASKEFNNLPTDKFIACCGDQVLEQSRRCIKEGSARSIADIESCKPERRTDSFKEKIRTFSNELVGPALAIRPYDQDSTDKKENPAQELRSGLKQNKEIVALWQSAERKLEKEREALRGRVDEKFDGFRRHLDSYVLSDYFPEISKNYDNDCTKLSALAGDAWEVAASFVYKACNGALEERRRYWRQKRRDAERNRASLQRALELRERQSFEAATALKNHCDAMQAFSETMQQDEERGREFTKVMTDTLRDELAIRRNEIAEQTLPARRFIKLLGAVAICDEAHKLLDA
jgi:hypothetical protein